MSRKPYTIALVQTGCRQSAEENLAAHLELAERAANLGADVICLQELFMGPYFCQQEDARLFDLAEPIPGPTSEAFATLAKKTGTAIVVSLFEKRGIGLYHNTAAVLGREGTLLGLYRKMHIPDDPPFTKSSTSPPATWVSWPWTPTWAASACACAGTSGTRRPRA